MKDVALPENGAQSGQPEFVHRGYYTLPVLANGVDFCMLDPSGSMAFKDHVKAYYSFWYKRGRPHAADPIGIVKLRYSFLSDKGKVEPGWFDQRLDTHTGRLVTRLKFYQLELDVEVLLTDDHTLIERYHVRKCDARNGAFRMEQTFPKVTYSFKPVRSLGALANCIRVSAEGSRAVFNYRFSGEGGRFEGVGITGVRVEGGGVVNPVQTVKQPIEPETSITVSRLRSGASILRITTLMDDQDSPSWRTEARQVHARYMARDIDHVRKECVARWRDYFARSSFECSNSRVGQGFDISLAVCRMGQHPNGSMATQLAVPCNHAMGTYWDAWYCGSGFLRTNHVAEARRLVDFWRSAYPLAKRLAREQKVGGARFPWVLLENVQPWAHHPASDGQIHNNVTPAINIFEQCLYTGDRKLLADSFELIQDSVRYLIERALRKDSQGHWHLTELVGVDESGKMKRDELTTATIARRGLRMIREAARITGLTPDPELLACEPRLDEVLRRQWVRGVWRSYEGADGGGMASPSAFNHLPDPRRFRRSIDDALRRCREPHGLGGGDSSRMRCSTFPWVEGQFAWSMAKNGDPRAFHFLEGMLRYTNFFGGFPEYHWLHGEPSRDWFIGAHGVYLAALAEVCVQRRDERLCVFPLGLRHLPWSEGAFRGFRVAGGILVDAEWGQKGRMRVALRNDSPDAQEFELKVGDGRAEPIRMKPGGTQSWNKKA
jgi:hypothetical protein